MARRFEFGVSGDIADLITHVKFYVNRFRGFGAVTPPNLSISMKLAGGSYNSISTAVLHCDHRTERAIKPLTPAYHTVTLYKNMLNLNTLTLCGSICQLYKGQNTAGRVDS